MTQKSFFALFNIERRENFLTELALGFDNEKSLLLIEAFSKENMPESPYFKIEKIKQLNKYLIGFISLFGDKHLIFSLNSELIKFFFIRIGEDENLLKISNKTEIEMDCLLTTSVCVNCEKKKDNPICLHSFKSFKKNVNINLEKSNE